ncbi:hypothetical protein AXK60_16660 [Tsukamurella pseudospumae]|uniref:HTH tetR-type domain-containing protein n=2 Tax=Tsukamurella pseudospumae TaxID=239498 RepID=A0A137ZZ24_9ACTN|nr:hypothetical protein AXK60_16660 [Tsukamurella pseudospumae]
MYAGDMSAPASFQTEVKQLLRDRALDATRDLVHDEGWGAVNMSLIAKRVGVSRTALYKAVGARDEVARALIARETDGYLAGVVARLGEHPRDLPAGFAAAATFALEYGADNALLKSILAGDRGDADLLPLLTTDPSAVLDRAIAAVAQALPARVPDGAVEVFVRLTVSHLLGPRGPVDRAADQISRAAGGLIPPS